MGYIVGGLLSTALLGIGYVAGRDDGETRGVEKVVTCLVDERNMAQENAKFAKSLEDQSEVQGRIKMVDNVLDILDSHWHLTDISEDVRLAAFPVQE